jgi:hypothetical protein
MFSLPASALAGGFYFGEHPEDKVVGWGAPIPPGSQVDKTEDTAVYIRVNMPFDQVLAWYKEAMKSYKEPQFNVDWAKFREWSDQVYIEDQGNARWHSIGIVKGSGATTTVKIVRMNMTWVFSTLLIRFAGVFGILCTLWLLLNLNNFIMKKFFPHGAGSKA